MDVALKEFVSQIEDSGILLPGMLEDFLPPKAPPQDVHQLARELIKRRQLTKFQAQEIYRGKAKSLLLGNYTILDKVGAGGMGEVFKAEHRRMKRIVAIKMLPKSLMKTAAAVARFQREVEAASKLLHPNIVSAFDADEANGVHFLVMEFVEGADLSALVKKNGPLSIEQAVNCVLQAAKGLEAAHKKGIVHRDVKPANVLLDNEDTIKLLDMGLARLQGRISGDATTQAELTGSGMMMGTVDYMAPEQALDSKRADARADIYSLGCTLYYLLTGKPMYGGNTPIERLLAHREQPIPGLPCRGDTISQQVEAVFRKMVAKKVEDRYQSVSDVLTDLERCVSGRTPMAITLRASAPSAADMSDLFQEIVGDPVPIRPRR